VFISFKDSTSHGRYNQVLTFANAGLEATVHVGVGRRRQCRGHLSGGERREMDVLTPDHICSVFVGTFEVGGSRP